MESVAEGTFEFNVGEEVIEGKVHPLWRTSAFREFQGRRLDLKSAYKQLGLRPDDRRSVVVSAFCPESGEAKFFLANSLLFGTTSAVYGFNRCALGLWWIGVTQLLLLATNYFDDYPAVESSPITDSSLQSFVMMLTLLGWLVSDGDKDMGFRTRFEVLGVEIALCLHEQPPSFEVHNKAQRVNDLVEMFTELLKVRKVKRRDIP
eukprot:6477510-Amphidinium_carterae.1